MTLPVAILAGGLATRIRPLTEKIPKSLLNIAGRPFIDHQLTLLCVRGIKKVVLCVGFLGEQIEAYVGSGERWDLEARYSYDGVELLGTGGAVRKALPLLGENFFVLYGDSYLPIDYELVERCWKNSGQPALMTVFKNEGRWDSSNAVFIPLENSEAAGTVALYSKKERVRDMRYIDYGLGCFSAGLFDSGKQNPFDLAELYSELAVQRRLAGYEVKERFYEAGSFEGIEDLASLLKTV